MAQNCTQTSLFGCAGNIFFKIIHICKTGHATLDKLSTGNQTSQTAKIRRNKFSLNRHHVSHQPHIQTQVIRKSAQEGHRHMRMRVDQTGHQDFSLAVDHFIGSIARFYLGFQPYSCNGVTLDDYCTRSILIHCIVHG